MKIIALTDEVPFSIVTNDQQNIEISKNTKSQLLNTPQTDRTSILKPILDNNSIVSKMNDIQIRQKCLQSSLFRNLNNVVFFGGINGLENTTPELSKKILHNLQENYRSNGFYPISFQNLSTDPKLFGDIRLRNIFFSTHWSDVLLKFNDDEIYESYVKFNEFVAEEILKIYKYEDIVWIPNQLYWLLPYYLRLKVPDVKICVTFMWQFPSSDQFACFSEPKHLLECLLEASYIEFQSITDLNNFTGFVKGFLHNATFDNGILHYKRDTKLSVKQFPIDSTLPSKILSTKKCTKYRNILQKRHCCKKIVVSLTTFETSHTLLNVYKAIETYFKTYNNKDVLFVNIESCVGNYDTNMRGEISRIEDYLRLQGLEDSVIRCTGLPDYKYFAWLSIADIGIVVTDNCALSLQAFDFLSLHQNDNAPLLVSKNSRFHKDLELVKINPKDEEEFSKKIDYALNIKPKDTKFKYQEILDRQDSQETWIKNLIKKSKKKFVIEKIEAQQDLEPIFNAFKAAKSPAFVFDYDGTLTPIVNEPSAAFPDEKLLNLLTKLKTKGKVLIVTGRDRETMDKWINDKEIEIYAEHGNLHRKGGKWEILFELEGWKEEAIKILDYFCLKFEGSFLENKDTSLCYHYRKCEAIIHQRAAEESKKTLIDAFKDHKELEVKEGKCVIEIRPKGVNKGDSIKEVLESGKDFIMCAGDDVTDEYMFSAGKLKNNFFSVLISDEAKQTSANYSVSSSEKFIEFLTKLVEN